MPVVKIDFRGRQIAELTERIDEILYENPDTFYAEDIIGALLLGDGGTDETEVLRGRILAVTENSELDAMAKIGVLFIAASRLAAQEDSDEGLYE